MILHLFLVQKYTKSKDKADFAVNLDFRFSQNPFSFNEKNGVNISLRSPLLISQKETREENLLLTMAGMDNKHASRNNASGRMIGARLPY